MPPSPPPSSPLASQCTKPTPIFSKPESVSTRQAEGAEDTSSNTLTVTPGITALEYSQRRTRLARSLPPGAIAILAAADIKYRSGAVFYDYHQDSNFFYLTGFNEPESLAVIEKSADGTDHIFHLYVRPKDLAAQQWEGARSGCDAARDVFNADETGDINNIRTILPAIISSASCIYTDIPHKPTSAQKPASSPWARLFSPTPSPSSSDFTKLLAASSTHLLKPLVEPLRSLKSPAEIALMRHIGRQSGRAFTTAMRGLPSPSPSHTPSVSFPTESLLTAHLEASFRTLGLTTSAYIPVVAGGRHALSIHYTRNDALLSPHELVLVDAGGTHGGYITDITRTWPVGGRFSDAQRDLYEAVLAAQRVGVALCREGETEGKGAREGCTLDGIHARVEEELRQNLQSIGFDMRLPRALETLFPHHVGHYIGLDVHDTPGVSRKEVLKRGHCVTVEPGVYVPSDDGRWPESFRGMGVRIEDSVAVGGEEEGGPQVLTSEAVKEVRDIEALRA
jgi:intermediate cleaving peptidase 55